MIEKYDSCRIRVQIRHVLLEVWDPIGVRDMPEAQDEYDSYLGEIFQLLTTGGTDEQIADYLWNQANDHMGSSIAREQMYPTVAALRKIQIPK